MMLRPAGPAGSRRFLAIVPWAAAALLAAGTPAAARTPSGPVPGVPSGSWTVSPLPVLPGPDRHVQVMGTDGSTAFAGLLGDRAVLWTRDRVVDLGDGLATDVNRRGDVVGIRGDIDDLPNSVPTVWRGGRAVELRRPAGAHYAIPQSINDSGTVLGLAELDGPTMSLVLWSACSPARVRDLGAGFADVMPVEVTGTGLIVGNVDPARRAVTGRPATGPRDLPLLPGATSSVASDAVGRFVAGAQVLPELGQQPVLWVNGRPRLLPGLPDPDQNLARAVNRYGTVAGDGWVRLPGSEPVQLPLPSGCRSTYTAAITDDSTIAGTCVFPGWKILPMVWTRQ